MSNLPYDAKPEQVVKLLETLERLFNKLNLGVMTEERKLFFSHGVGRHPRSASLWNFPRK